MIWKSIQGKCSDLLWHSREALNGPFWALNWCKNHFFVQSSVFLSYLKVLRRGYFIFYIEHFTITYSIPNQVRNQKLLLRDISVSIFRHSKVSFLRFNNSNCHNNRKEKEKIYILYCLYLCIVYSYERKGTILVLEGV